METLVTANFPCSQKDVVSVLETAWDNYDLHIGRLSAYKPTKYDAALSVAARARIAAARALPDFQARSGEAEELHIELQKRADLCLHDFQLLKGYIDDVYQGAQVAYRKPNYEEAGQLYYRDASQGDWESVQSLGDSMKNYIITKLPDLTGVGNMPAAFQADVEGRRLDFEKTYTKFKIAEQTQVATAEKVMALNACYTEGMDMMKDGQRVNVDDPAVRSLFVFSNLLEMINPKTAGVRGRVQDALSHEALVGAVISLLPENEPVIVVNSDEEGDYASLRIRAQSYAMKVEMPGYVPQELNVVVETGTVSVKNFSLVRV